MSAFRRVEDAQAGPQALGVLVPPGRRTVVIVRPRGLAWDLLPVRAEEAPGSPFQEVGVAEAADLARQLRCVLEEGGAPIRIEPLSAPAGYEVRATIGSVCWVACPRTPGKPYRPAVFATLHEALQAADAMTAILCPAEDADQELYFNTHHFSR